MSGGGGGGGGKGSENLIFGAIGVAAGISLLFLLTAHVSARIFTGLSPVTTFSEMPSVLIGLTKSPGNPAMAFPPADQTVIPGPLEFYGTMLVIGAVMTVVGIGIFKLIKGIGSPAKSGLGGKGTQWAKRGDIKTLIVKGPTPGRLILGTVSGATVATEQRHSVIIFGPTQSGKTTGLAVPSILEWDGPIIATSVKNDLAQDTMGWRERSGPVWVYDPTQTTGLPTSTWSPLDGARDWSGAKKIASWLTSAAKSGSKGLSDGDFWYSAAGKLMAPHLFAAAANNYTMADVVRWIDTQEEFEVRSLLQATGVEEAIMAAEASWQREDRARSSIYTTAEVVIEAYSEPTILASARTSEIRASKFFETQKIYNPGRPAGTRVPHHTLYVCAPSHEQDRLRPVFSTLLKQFIRAAYDLGGRLDPPLLIVLDEAANIAPLDDLDAIASTCSGLGIQLVTVWQDLAQINNRYGDRATTVVNNHRAKVVLSGISDTSTLDYVSRLIGSEEIKSTSTSYDAEGKASRTVSNTDKNLAPADVVRRIKINEGLLIYGALLPARLKLRPWYRSKRLTAMVKNQLPGGPAPEVLAGPPDTTGGSNGGYEDFQRTSPVG